jgi:hypothetical protein
MATNSSVMCDCVGVAAFSFAETISTHTFRYQKSLVFKVLFFGPF